MSEKQKLVIGLDVDDHLLATNDYVCSKISNMMGEEYGFLKAVGGHINAAGRLDELVDTGAVSRDQLHSALVYRGTPLWDVHTTGLDQIASWVIESHLITGMTGRVPYRPMPGASNGLAVLRSALHSEVADVDYKVVTARPNAAHVRQATCRQLMEHYPELKVSSSHFVGNDLNGGTARCTKHQELERLGAVAFLDDHSKYIEQIQHDRRILPVLVGEHPWQDLSRLDHSRVLHIKDWSDDSVELVIEGIEQTVAYRNSKLG